MREFFDRHYKIIYYIAMAAIAFWIAYTKGWIFANFDSLSANEALKLIKDKKVVVVDVRSKEEYERGHIKDAILIPYEDLEKNLDNIDKNKTVLIYSKTGRVGISASRLLSSKGYKVINVKSGILGLAIDGGKKYPFLFEK